MAELAVRLGPLSLRNPVIAGAGEATATAAQIRACLAAGAAAVVAKSTNESDAAKRQLRAAEYVLLDEDLRPRTIGPARRSDSLYCRSGLVDEPFEQWCETLAALDAEAATLGAYVVPSIIVADLDRAVQMARSFEHAGVRWLELNVGAPHAQEAAAGTIRTGAELVAPVRKAISLPLTVKVASVEDALAAHAAGADGVVLSTRAQGFVPDLETRRPLLGTFAVIGGAWSLPLTCRDLAKARQRLGDTACLVGTNGARDGLDVARLLLSGATAAQLTTVVMTDGPPALAHALDQLERYLDQHGVDAADLIGEAADAVQTYEEAARERRH